MSEELQKLPPLPAAIKARGAVFLRAKLEPQTIAMIRAARAEHGDDWIHKAAPGGLHLTWGMAVRNILREIYEDSSVPTGNWDDYYIEVIELAADLSPGA